MVVEVLGAHDRVCARHRIAAAGPESECTVGRSAACDVVLDDPFVAAVHARIAVDADGHVVVSDLDTINGVEVGGRRLRGVERVPLADGVFRVGRTRLRVRTAHEIVAPEQADGGGRPWLTPAAEQRALGAAFAVSVAVSAFEVWTRTARPRDLSTALVSMLLGLLAVAGLWVALWALVSRVAFGESRWVRHAVILFIVYAGFSVVGLATHVVNGALGLHLWSSAGTVLVAVAASAALVVHLLNASPMRARTALAVGVTIPAVILVASLWFQARGHARSPSHIADRDHVLPPALVLRRGLTPDALTAAVADLKSRADAKRAFVEREDPSPDSDSDAPE